jgi:hypothetical protein
MSRDYLRTSLAEGVPMTTQLNTPRTRGDQDAPTLAPLRPDEDVRTILINRVSWGAVRTCASPPPWAKRWRQKIRHSATPRP